MCKHEGYKAHISEVTQSNVLLVCLFVCVHICLFVVSSFLSLILYFCFVFFSFGKDINLCLGFVLFCLHDCCLDLNVSVL